MMKTICIAILGLLLAQRPAFDVVSIKPMASNSPGMSMQTNPGRFFTRGSTLRFLIQYAYRVKAFQITGGPDWMNVEKYEIEGKFNAAENTNNDDKLVLMLQTALEQRFNLKFHRETREMAVFELTIAREGPKLKPASSEPRTGGGRGAAPLPGSPRSLRMQGATMPALAALLSDSLGRLVVDKTQLTGEFDLALEYSDDTSPAATTETTPRAPSLFTALQEQLGLKLESGKAQVELFILDSAQRPAQN